MDEQKVLQYFYYSSIVLTACDKHRQALEALTTV